MSQAFVWEEDKGGGIDETKKKRKVREGLSEFQ